MLPVGVRQLYRFYKHHASGRGGDRLAGRPCSLNIYVKQLYSTGKHHTDIDVKQLHRTGKHHTDIDVKQLYSTGKHHTDRQEGQPAL